MFRKDLNFGQHYEQLWASTLENPEMSPLCIFSDWDIKTDKETYEVKADRLVHKYGNFFIEYECSGKPSGISTTQADYWILYDIEPNNTDYGQVRNVYKVPTDILAVSIAPKCPSKKGGDGWRSKGYIVSSDKLKQYQLSCTPCITS